MELRRVTRSRIQPRGSSLDSTRISARGLVLLGLCAALQCFSTASARRGLPRQRMPLSPHLGSGAPAPADPGIPAPGRGPPATGPGQDNEVVAPIAEQVAEMKALMQFAQGLNEHPAFTTPSPAGSPWVNATVRQALPCAAGWAWIRCSDSQRVVSINMSRLVLNQANSSWGSSPGYLPLTGSIAWASLARLRELEVLILSGNAVSGTLTGVGLLPSLTELWLDSNQIEGIIPDSGPPAPGLGAVQRTAEVTFGQPGHEAPSGEDAGSILASSLWARVDPDGIVDEEQSSEEVTSTSAAGEGGGSLDSPDTELGAAAAKSARATSAGRASTSLIPGLPPTLVSLNLDTNFLTGSLPRVLSVLTGLTRLNVALNSLHGPFPAHLNPLEGLGFLDLHTNFFSGTLPDSWSALTQLTQLNLADTQVLLPEPGAQAPAPAPLPAAAPGPGAPVPGVGPTGPAAAPPVTPILPVLNGPRVPEGSPSTGIPLAAPATAGTMAAETERNLLGHLGLALAPMAPGPSAAAWPTTGVPLSWSNMVSIKKLSLSNCSMPGRYPLALTLLPAIEDISVNANQLYGPLPAGLWDPTRLVVLNLSSNYFQGSVPEPSNSTANNPIFHLDASLNCLTPDSAAAASQRSTADCDAFYASLHMPPPSQYPAPAPPAPLSPEPSSALSTGAVVAIAVSLALLLLLFIFAALLIFRRRKASKAGGTRPSQLRRFRQLNGEGGPGREKLGEGRVPAHANGGEHAAGAAAAASAIAGGAVGGSAMGSGTQGSFVGPLGGASHSAMVIERQGAREYSLWELEEATDGFSPANLVGKGGFGEVYYGELKAPGEDPSREGGVTKVAVKRQKLAGWGSAGPDESFRNEIRILSGAYHRNLVTLRGYCWEEGQLLLVFDFVPRGSLQQLLHGAFGGADAADKAGAAPGKSGSSATGSSGEKDAASGGAHGSASSSAKGDGHSGGSRRSALQSSPKELWSQKGLSWQERVQLAVGAARGINFLHNGALQPILHLDIKSGNILVDEQYTAKVSDFGLSTLSGDSADDAPAAEDHAVPGWQGAAPNAENLDGVSIGATAGTFDEGASRKGTLGFSRMKTRVRGTPGYIDPERGAGSFVGQLSEKSDVYSFGVVLLELATGWKPLQRVDGEGPKVHIVKRVLQTVNTHGMQRLLEIFNDSIKERAASDANELLADSSRVKEGAASEANEAGGSTVGPLGSGASLGLYSRFVCLAMWSCVFFSARRPTMRQVLRVLSSLEEGSEEWGEERAILHNGKFRDEDFRCG